MTNSVTEDDLVQIEHLARCESARVFTHIPALCQTVRALWAQVEHFESPDGEGKCRFCGNLRDAPHGHIQKCYCIPTIRQYHEENTALREQLADAQFWRRQAEGWIADVEEREAAVCPEDVGFDEYIRTLQSRLAQVEKEREYWRSRATEADKAAEKWYHERY